MEVFEIEFLYFGFPRKAEVTKVGNLYRVSPEDDHLAELYGEYVFTEQGGKFLYKAKHITHTEYLVAVSIALTNCLSP
jgi:hypothetical protein